AAPGRAALAPSATRREPLRAPSQLSRSSNADAAGSREVSDADRDGGASAPAPAGGEDGGARGEAGGVHRGGARRRGGGKSPGAPGAGAVAGRAVAADAADADAARRDGGGGVRAAGDVAEGFSL